MPFNLPRALEFNKFTMGLAAGGFAYVSAILSDRPPTLCIKVAGTIAIGSFAIAVVLGAFIIGRSTKIEDNADDNLIKRLGQWHSIFLFIGLIIASVLMVNKIWNRVDASAPLPRAAMSLQESKPIVWAQLRPDDANNSGQLIARAIVASDSKCPEASFEGPLFWAGKTWRLSERWSGGDGRFPIKVCEIAYPGHLAAKIGEIRLDPRPSDPRSILVLGDTGCRIKDRQMQSCNSIAEWPFKLISAMAATLKPDLIVHVGDYHYRETPCTDPSKCAGSPYGDNWDAWRADMFDPAAPLLARAPWIMLRGNHEGWTRAGTGWQIFLSPQPRHALDSPWPEEEAPYIISFENLMLAILDVANSDDRFEASQRKEKYRQWIIKLAATLMDGKKSDQAWLFQHRPLWMSTKCQAEPCIESAGDKDPLNAIRDVVRKPNFDLVFGGDTHMLEFFVPSDPNVPPQIVAGMSGTELESDEQYEEKILDKPVDANLFNVRGQLWMRHEFGFLMLTKKNGAWSAAFHDTHAVPKIRCDLPKPGLARTQNQFPCRRVSAS